MRQLGLILIVIGIIMTVFTGFNIVTKKKVVDVGPLEIKKEEKTPIYWSPYTGLALTAGGIVVLLIGRKK
jgi:hypothetical protein